MMHFGSAARFGAPFARLLLVAIASLGAQLASQAPSAFPRRIAGYSFYPDLASAAAVASRPGAKGKIVIYAVRSLQRRDRVDWIIAQESIFTHPVTKAALRDIPLVCLQDDRGEGKSLGLPTSGLCIVDATSRAVEHTMSFAETHARTVGPKIAKLLGVEVQDQTPFVGPRGERDRYRKGRSAILKAFANGQPEVATALVREAQSTHPDRIVTRLLAHEARLQAGPGRPHPARPGGRRILDRVYVVPDVATYLATLRRWGAGPMFPVLLYDNEYLPRFIRSFAPAEVLYVPPVEPTPLTEKLLRATLSEALGSTPTPPGDGSKPGTPGLVLTHPRSPLAAAGVALAAGHRQRLAMLPPVANPELPIYADEARQIRDAVRARLDATGKPWNRVHDDIDYLTIATELPYRYRDRSGHDRSMMAVDDLLGRDRDDLPVVYTGRLQAGHGPEPAVRGIYQAMCALFLHVENPLLFGHYSNRGQWSPYLTEDAVPALAAGRPTLIAKPTATLSAWRSIFRGKQNRYDLVHVNSSGTTTEWSTGAGRGSFTDLPRTLPAIVSYVHSNSLGNGYDADTIGGRWLRNGAYSYFGAIDEPFLDAFVPPSLAFGRAVKKNQPLAMAHRRQPGSPRWRPWKLMLFGDPLLRIRFGKPARQATPLPKIPGAVLLRDATQSHPLGGTPIDQQLFDLHIAALGQNWATVRQGAHRLLTTAGAAPTTTRNRTRLANLIAWHQESAPKLEGLLALLPGLRQHEVRSPALSTIGNELFFGRLREDRDLSGDALGDLLVAQVSLGHSKAMMKRIGRTYIPRLDGPQLQRVREIFAKQKPQPANLDQLWQAF